MIAKLQENIRLSEKRENEIEKLAQKLAQDHTYRDIAATELAGGRSFKAGKTARLLRVIRLYNESLPTVEACRRLYNENSERVLRLTKELSAGSTGLSWFLSTAKRKTTAESAFARLQAESESPYYQNAQDAIRCAMAVTDVTDQEIWSDLANKTQAYRNTFYQFAPGTVETGERVPALTALSDALQSLHDKLLRARTVQNQAKSNVAQAGKRFLTQEVVNILRGIPVEELNRDKKGIRVKALREGGYCNMADLLTASAPQISAVRGIGVDTAYTIAAITRKMAEDAQKTVKIKLSVDHKTKEATALLAAIYAYRKTAEAVAEADAFEKQSNAYIRPDLTCLDRVKNGAPWLFFTADQKTEVLQARDRLQQQVKGDYAKQIDRHVALMQKAYHISKDEVWQDFAKQNIAYYNVLEEVMPGLLGNNDGLYGLTEELARAIQDECFFPDGLMCELRRYQEWGVKYILHQERVLLGDEMGLGKTVQAIAAMVSLRNTGATHFIVVCPASVLTNWCREIVDKSKLRVTMVHGQGKNLALQSWLKTGGVAVMTYDTTGSFKFDDAYRFELLVVDEAHYIKNTQALRSVRVRALADHANRLLLMTGTALENRVDEMISLIEVCQPKVAAQIRPISFMSTAPQFRERIAPVYYRRKREDVLTELPDKIESKEWCVLSGEEEAIYEASVLDKHYMEARRLSWNVSDLNVSCKAQRMMELINEAAEDGRKTLVFSFFLDTLRAIRLFLGDRCIGQIDGSVSPQRRQEIIDAFDDAPAGTVLCAQIQSGGTGLNIQAASMVIICEPQLKPSVENQAISRAYRMGQARNVLVYRLLCEDTIDERITALLAEKQAVFNAFADRSVAAMAAEGKEAEIDDKTLGKIIEEEIKRINTKNGQQPTDRSADATAADPTAVVSFTAKKRGVKKDSVAIAPAIDPAVTLAKARNTDYGEELRMTYAELVRFLLNKYGPAKEDYFLTEACVSINRRVSRTAEGLVCHHIDEDKAIMLCNDKFAKNNPFTYQKAERLVYCNILEHLLLHVKIAEEPRNAQANKNELQGIGGAATFICSQINDYFNGYTFTREWQIIQMSVLEGHFEDYIAILSHLWEIVKANPTYSLLISKGRLCCGWDGDVVEKVFQRLE